MSSVSYHLVQVTHITGEIIQSMIPIVTERLILKPLQIDDYESWFF